MEPTRLQQVEELYHAALEIAPSERDAFLEKACSGDERLLQEVQSLIHHDEQARSFLESSTVGEITSPSSQASLEPGLVFEHRFRLLRKLGEGGMGQVWLAEQTSPVRRQVALKLIKAGMYDAAVVQRFQAERQSLAIMDHPTIAKVFDAGTTDQGQPYFVMEYVPGLPITAYCDQKKLTIKQRIELFIQACEGVQHAHQKAIIHRDLKPANILVIEIDGKPVPRIIDFGLAKATTHRPEGESLFTQVGYLIGTPAYMSPEQADSSQHDIDTRTDVYSLGVVLYVLLTGELPLDMRQGQVQPLEMLRKLLEEEPPSPSVKVSSDRGQSSATAEARGTEPAKLASLLRGDLDWITLKALEKDRERRYASPSDLVADLRRHLSHKLVLARPASVGYRLQKYIRRNRVAVAVVSTLILLLAGFAAVQTSELHRITVERDRANRERDRATRITDFMTSMFKVSDPSEARGNSITAREILDRVSKDVDAGLVKDPDLQAQMMHVMGSVYVNLGLYSQGRLLLSRAVEIRQRVLGPEHRDTLASMRELAHVLDVTGDYAGAEKLLRQAIDVQRRVLGPEHHDTLSSMNGLANILADEGHMEEAESLYRQVLDASRRVLGPQHPDTLKPMGNLAATLEERGKYAEAEKLQRETLDIGRSVRGPEHPDTAAWMHNLANVLSLEGRYSEAATLYRETIDIDRRILGPEHPSTLLVMGNLAETLEKLGQYAESEKLCRTTLEARRRVLGPEHPDSLVAASDLAFVIGKQGNYRDAYKLLSKTLEIQHRVLGPNNPDYAASIYNLACFAAWQGHSNEAVSLLREALDHGLDDKLSLGLEHDDELQKLRADPRFKAMIVNARQRLATPQKPD